MKNFVGLKRNQILNKNEAMKLNLKSYFLTPILSFNSISTNFIKR